MIADYLRRALLRWGDARKRRTELLASAVDHVAREYGAKGYEFWRGMIKEQIIFAHPADPSIEIEVQAAWDAQTEKPDGPIRVFVALQHATPMNVLLPVRSFVVNQDNTIDLRQ
jgi:hypothetical protein